LDTWVLGYLDMGGPALGIKHLANYACTCLRIYHW